MGSGAGEGAAVSQVEGAGGCVREEPEVRESLALGAMDRRPEWLEPVHGPLQGPKPGPRSWFVCLLPSAHLGKIPPRSLIIDTYSSHKGTFVCGEMPNFS